MDPQIYSRADARIHIHADDLLMISHGDVIDSICEEIDKEMIVKWLGDIEENNWRMYLGREWQRVANGFVSRTPMHYVHGLLSQEKLEYAKGVDTPFIPAEPEDDDDKIELADKYVQSRYCGVVDRLMWLVGDRPDLAYVVKELARAVAEPQKRDEQAMKRALKYLSRTQSWCMWFLRKPEETTDTIRVFVNASWASGRGRRSTSGGLITVAGFPMMWWSRTQPTIAQGSCEAELVAANTGATEA